ncbi:MAG: hypothetical protein QXP22_02965 [Candidatus Anstonellales archaeon]
MAVDFLLNDIYKVKELDHVKISNAVVLHVYGHGFSIMQNNNKAFVYALPMHIKNIKARDEIKIMNAKIRNNAIYTTPLSVIEVIKHSKFLSLEELNGRGYFNVYAKSSISDNKLYLCSDKGKYEVKNAIIEYDNIDIYISDVLFSNGIFYAKPFTRFFIKNRGAIKNGDARI